MAKIVELVGPPGVGKTTLYKELETYWEKSYNWMPSQYFYPKKQLVAETSGTFILSVLQRIKDKSGKVDLAAMEEAGGRFVELYPEYIDACWNNINCICKRATNEPDLRLQKVSYLFKIIKKIQIVREQNSTKIAIVDEGLVHMIPSILYKKESIVKEKEEIEKLLQLMPLPDAVISIETDVHENISRLMQRNKVIPMHRYLNLDQLENITLCDYRRRTMVNDCIKNREIPFLYINSSEDIEENVSKIMSFAETL